MELHERLQAKRNAPRLPPHPLRPAGVTTQFSGSLVRRFPLSSQRTGSRVKSICAEPGVAATALAANLESGHRAAAQVRV